MQYSAISLDVVGKQQHLPKEEFVTVVKRSSPGFKSPNKFLHYAYHSSQERNVLRT